MIFISFLLNTSLQLQPLYLPPFAASSSMQLFSASSSTIELRPSPTSTIQLHPTTFSSIQFQLPSRISCRFPAGALASANSMRGRFICLQIGSFGKTTINYPIVCAGKCRLGLRFNPLSGRCASRSHRRWLKSGCASNL